MLDNSLLKSNFVGRDGFRWWIGQIPPEDSHSTQIDKDGWGNRMKVRIMGYHPFDDTELTNDDLPWAQVLLPTTVGSGAGNYAADAKIQPADTVFGFFLDGDNAQLPVIVGVFGRTKEVSTEKFKSPFVPFTGYTSKIDNDGSKLIADQTNEKTETSQQSPYHLPPQDANGMNQISYSSVIGDVTQFASTTSDSFINKISNEMENTFKFISDLKSFPGLSEEFINAQTDSAIEELTPKIQGITGGLVNGVINDLYKEMAPKLNEGVIKLYDTVNGLVRGATQSISQAHLAAVKAQEAIMAPLQDLQNAFPCMFYNIFGELGGIIGSMLSGLLKSATDFAACLVDQFVGGLLNKVIGAITGILDPILGALSAVLDLIGGFDLGGILRGSFSGMAGVPFSLNVCETGPKVTDEVKQWKTGTGVRCSPSKDLAGILDLANTAAAAVQSPGSLLDTLLGTVGNVIDTAGNVVNAAGEVLGTVDAVVSTVSNASFDVLQTVGNLDIFSGNIADATFTSALSSCYAGPQLFAKEPKVNIVGGSGSGAVIEPVYGSVVENPDAGTNPAVPDVTTSIIGAIVTNGGSGYKTPPFVELRTKTGYGAIVKTEIKDGKVTRAYVMSDGVGYYPGNKLDRQNNVTITDVAILNPGTGYSDTDVAKDNLGNTYNLQVYKGSIVKVSPLNITSISDLPKIFIESSDGERSSGKGAILKPVFGYITTEEIGGSVVTRDETGRAISVKEIKQSIDCIQK